MALVLLLPSALDLDKEEQQLLSQDGDENNGLIEWLKANPQSQNVSDDGNFSIQVLRRALDNLGLAIKYWGNEATADAQSHPENEQGFICNLQAHWFAIRRIGGVWYNLNSLSGLPETTAVPTTISNFYLSAYLSTLANDGYSINVVQSDKWPHLHSYDAQQLLPEYCKWYMAKDVKARSESYPKHLLEQVDKSRTGKHVTNLGWGSANGGGGMTADQQMQYAMQQSLGQSGGGINGFGGDGMGMAEDPELAHALALSMNDHNTNSKGNQGHSMMGNNGNELGDDEEALLATALAMSMEEDQKSADVNGDGDEEEAVTDAVMEEEIEVVDEPEEDAENVCMIQMRLPGNKRIGRRFLAEHTLNDVANFVKSEVCSLCHHCILCTSAMNSFVLNRTLRSRISYLCARQ